MMAMTIGAAPASLRLAGRRALYAAGFATLVGLFNSVISTSPTTLVVGRALIVGACALAAFSLFEGWPRRLPVRLARWVVQVASVVVAVPIGAFAAYWLTTGGDFGFLQQNSARIGLGFLTLTSLVFAPWIAFGAMLLQREAFARSQQLAFALERSELERQALDARMRLLQAQVQPHFLFNTLANVQALVDTGSPEASQVLGKLVAYLRAAVPRLDDASSTIGDEVTLARSYLELMHMRMPDRLQFEIRVDGGAADLRCPPLALLTLVENAVRHGIDPSEEGGMIGIHIQHLGDCCRIVVSDTGVGLQQSGGGLGTGLSALRERLQLGFGDSASLDLTAVSPHGACATLRLPAQMGHA